MSPPKDWRKPDAPLIGANRNPYSVMGIAGKAIKAAGGEAASKQYFEDAKGCQSYDALLAMTMEWIEPVAVPEPED